MINIDEITVGQARLIAKMFSDTCVNAQAEEHPWQVDRCYLIRTVTMHLTGKLVGVHQQELVLENAAWIADSGRFSDALRTGEFNEVEPFPDGRVIIGRGSVVDAAEVPHQPRSQK